MRDQRLSRRRLRGGKTVAVVAALTLFVTACGGDDSGSDDASAGDDLTTTTLVQDDTDDTTTTTVLTDDTVVGTDDTTTTLDTGTTLPGGTPTTRRTTATTARGGTATTRKSAGGGTTTTTTSGGATPAKKGTIKLGRLFSSIAQTGGTRTNEEDRKVAEQWLAEVKRNGGINGYTIELAQKDWRADPSRAVQAVKELEQDGVLALAGSGNNSLYTATIMDFLQEKKLPLVGGIPFFDECAWHPMCFPTSATAPAGRYGIVAAARDAGAKHFFNGYCTEVPACQAGVAMYRYAATREGMKYTAQTASTQAVDYTAICLNARNAGADFVQSTGLNFANLVRDCTRQNYHPTFGSGGTANQATIDAAKGEALYGGLYELPIFYDGPEIQPLKRAMARTDLMGDQTAAQPGQASVQTWLGLEMTRAVIMKLTQEKPTRQDFLNALYTIKGETLGGLSFPIDYSMQRPGTGEHAGNDCWTEYLLKDGKLHMMNKSGQIAARPTFICGTGFKYTTSGPPPVPS